MSGRSVEMRMMMRGGVGPAASPTTRVGCKVQEPHDRSARGWRRHLGRFGKSEMNERMSKR